MKLKDSIARQANPVALVNLSIGEELRTFVVVIDSGGLSAAARMLRVTTNAVSRRVKRLEDHFKVRLLNRTTRKISLTNEGQRLYERAVRILEEFGAIAGDLNSTASELRGLVRIALPAAAANQTLLARLGELLAAHPQLEVQLQVLNRTIDVIGGAVDIALHYGDAPDSTLVARKLGTASWHLAATPAYLDLRGRPRTPADLGEHTCLRLLGDRSQNEWLLTDEAGNTTKALLRGNFECDDSRLLGDAVYAGLGIGIRPKRELEAALQNGLLERVLPQHRLVEKPVFALMPPGRSRTSAVKTVFPLLQQAVEQIL